MKKLLLVLIIILVSGCTKAPAPEPGEKEYTVEDYFPFLENTILSYAGEGNEYAEKDVYFDFIEGNRAQARVSNPGTTLAQVYEVSNGEVRLLSSTGEMYAFYNTMERLAGKGDGAASGAEIVLKEPLEKGNKWELPDGRTREITGVRVSVETPHKKYEAIEVTTAGRDSTIKDYYAAGIGLIKSVFTSGDYKVISALEAIETDTAIKQDIRFYYPDFNNDMIVYVEERVEFKTNADIKELLGARLKEAPGREVNRVLGENVTINDIAYSPEDGAVTVDFSENLVAGMNAGADLEGQILASIANTFGSYFNANKIYIRLDGRPYESGHILMKENEYLTPQIEEAAPYDRQ